MGGGRNINYFDNIHPCNFQRLLSLAIGLCALTKGLQGRVFGDENLIIGKKFFFPQNLCKSSEQFHVYYFFSPQLF